MAPNPRQRWKLLLHSVDRPGDCSRLQHALIDAAKESNEQDALEFITSLDGVTPTATAETTVVLVLVGGSLSVDAKPTEKLVKAARVTAVDVWVVFNPEVDFHAQCPRGLDELNGVAWQPAADPTPVARSLLRALGLDEDDRRYFISYARKDGTALAVQVRHALLDQRCRAFLDTVDIKVGAPFQQALTRELDDRSVLVLIETPHAAQSPWIDYELAFAKSHGIAIRTVSPPPSGHRVVPRTEASTTPVVTHAAVTAARTRTTTLTTSVTATANDGAEEAPLGWRLDAAGRALTSPDDYEIAENGDIRLAGGALVRLAGSLQAVHTRSYRLRRESLLQSVINRLEDRGLTVQPLNPWSVLGVDRKSSTRELVLVASRRPMPEDVYRAASLRTEHPDATKTWVVHRTVDPDQGHLKLLAWIGRDDGPTMASSPELRNGGVGTPQPARGGVTVASYSEFHNGGAGTTQPTGERLMVANPPDLDKAQRVMPQLADEPDRPALRVFVSASVPYGDRAEQAKPFEIEDIQLAVAATFEAIIGRDHVLVFGGHPAITPLALSIDMLLHKIPRGKDRERIELYQSAFYRADADNPRDRLVPELATLAEGRARVIWTPEGTDHDDRVAALREQMLEQRIDAAFFIGGMNGVADESRLVAEKHPTAARFYFSEPGGMAARVAGVLDPTLDEEGAPAVRPLPDGSFALTGRGYAHLALSSLERVEQSRMNPSAEF